MSNKSSFTKLLLDLSNGLTSEELRELKHLCRDDIGAAKLEKIERGYELFQELQNRDLLSKDKRDYLATKLVHVGKSTLSRSLLGKQGRLDFENSIASLV